MKADIHPKCYESAKIKCACGNQFSDGAAVTEIKVEVCYKCHPFYTGQMKFVDTAGRVDAFLKKQKKAKKKVLSKTEKRKLKREKKIKEESEKPDSLEEIRKAAKKRKNN